MVKIHKTTLDLIKTKVTVLNPMLKTTIQCRKKANRGRCQSGHRLAKFAREDGYFLVIHLKIMKVSSDSHQHRVREYTEASTIFSDITRATSA